jgi:hypothetical protein
MDGRSPSFTVGSDRVQRAGLALTIFSRIDMDDLQVRHYRRVAVWVDGLRYTVAGRAAAGNGAIRYRLEPWPPDDADPPGTEVIYDRGYVEERDRLHSTRGRNVVISRLLLPVHPFLGFLWFPTKERLQLSLGVEPGRITGQGLFLQYLAILILGCLSIIARHAPLGLSNGWLFGLILVLLPDAIMRWSLSNDGFPAGIFEWLVRRRRP